MLGLAIEKAVVLPCEVIVGDGDCHVEEAGSHDALEGSTLRIDPHAPDEAHCGDGRATMLEKKGIVFWRIPREGESRREQTLERARERPEITNFYTCLRFENERNRQENRDDIAEVAWQGVRHEHFPAKLACAVALESEDGVE